MEHIEEWSKVKEHSFDNMVVLCATCHARVTSKEIRKDAIRIYKRNLAIVNGRYSLYELRALEHFHDCDQCRVQAGICIAANDLLHVRGLIEDGLIEFQEKSAQVFLSGVDVTPVKAFPTKIGWDFIGQYFGGQEVA